MLFAQLDRHGHGTINATEFIAALRTISTPLRRAWVRRVWSAFPKDRHGSVATTELRRRYRACEHPDVLCGVRSEDSVTANWNATFNEVTNPLGYVTRLEFDEYCAGVSAAVFDDDRFVALLGGVWPLSGVNQSFMRDLARGVCHLHSSLSTRQSIEQQQAVMLECTRKQDLCRVVETVHRASIMAHPLLMRELSLALRRAAMHGSNATLAGQTDAMSANATPTFLSRDRFLSELRQLRFYFPNDDMVSVLDTNGDGSVDYLYYLELMVPPLPAARHLMIMRLWQRVFSQCSDDETVDVHELHTNATMHSCEEKDIFLSAWSVRLTIAGRVHLSEFVEWYAVQSQGVSLDKDFEALLARHWAKRRTDITS